MVKSKKITLLLDCRCGKESNIRAFKKFPVKIRCPKCKTGIIINTYMKIEDIKGVIYQPIFEYMIKSSTITLKLNTDNLPDRVNFV